MLAEKDKFDTDDFKRMLGDQVSSFAGEFTPVYLNAISEMNDGIYGEANQILKEWDYNMGVESSAALIFDFMYLELIDALFHDELGDKDIKYMYGSISRNLIHKIKETGVSPWCDNVNTDGTIESFGDNIRTAFTSTIDSLATMYGENPADWKWGDLHKVSLIHPMGSVAIVNKLFKTNRGPIAIGGSYHTVCPYSYTLNSSFVADWGASERHIFNTADWDASLTVIPTGTSGVPASEHYLDQTDLYVNSKFHADHFSRESVEKNALYKTTIKQY